MKQNLKRMISVLLMLAMILPLLPYVPVIAESEGEKYPYTLFASSKQEGAITIHASNFSVNGTIATNGTVTCDGQFNLTRQCRTLQFRGKRSTPIMQFFILSMVISQLPIRMSA